MAELIQSGTWDEMQLKGSRERVFYVCDNDVTRNGFYEHNGRAWVTAAASTLAALRDVDLTGVADLSLLKYDLATAKFKVASFAQLGLALCAYMLDFIMPSGMRVMPTNIATTSAAGAAVGVERVAPFVLLKATTFNRIGLNVTAAGVGGTTIRLGIRSSLASGLPGALVLDAGAIDGTSVSYQEIVINQTLQPGLYWLCVLPLGGGPTITVGGSGHTLPSVSATPISVNLPRGYTSANGLAAFPGNFGAPNGDVAGPPAVVLAVA